MNAWYWIFQLFELQKCGLVYWATFPKVNYRFLHWHLIQNWSRLDVYKILTRVSYTLAWKSRVRVSQIQNLKIALKKSHSLQSLSTIIYSLALSYSTSLTPSLFSPYFPAFTGLSHSLFCLKLTATSTAALFSHFASREHTYTPTILPNSSLFHQTMGMFVWNHSSEPCLVWSLLLPHRNWMFVISTQIVRLIMSSGVLKLCSRVFG